MRLCELQITTIYTVMISLCAGIGADREKTDFALPVLYIL